MDKVFAIVGMALSCAAVILLLRRDNPSLAAAASVCAGIAILSYIWSDLTSLLSELYAYGGKDSSLWIGACLKVTLMCLLGQWGSTLLRDAGENAVADKAETAVKILILTVCWPFLTQLLDLAKEIG